MFKEEFAKKMKQARKKRGYTQKEVEQETGIKRELISYIETGRNEPSLENLAILINFYEINANWLLGTGAYGEESIIYRDDKNE